jgi:hypothetical protein
MPQTLSTQANTDSHFPGSHFPDWLDKTEARIISRAIQALLDQGWHIWVHDGEDFAMDRPARDIATIEAACATTGETRLIASMNTATGHRRVGFVQMIHGNGLDVLSDHTASQAMEKALEPVTALIEEIEAEEAAAAPSV